MDPLVLAFWGVLFQNKKSIRIGGGTHTISREKEKTVFLGRRLRTERVRDLYFSSKIKFVLDDSWSYPIKSLSVPSNV
ncbi:hypothetical protein HanRHA438_Chr06g0287171 [Helianthus annuus]|nr:hypothetical protein HanPI659440_Chr13g0480771 [Helianthus annuus]KAJ0913577.1 hypothetical protein HanRHA438_Chr06g0287171 [Helianthus annuus]